MVNKGITFDDVINRELRLEYLIVCKKIKKCFKKIRIK